MAFEKVTVRKMYDFHSIFSNIFVTVSFAGVLVITVMLMLLAEG